MGAKKRDIRNQFLIEGLILTVVSGIISYIIGFIIAYIISSFLPFSIFPNFKMISIAIGITTFIGMVFSIAPANFAARKNLTDILK